MSRRQRKAETRAQVLAAARHCFGEHGYESTTIAHIAKQAQVSVGTVHLHFVDKANLVAAAFYDDIEAVLDQAWQTLPPSHDPMDTLLHPAAALYAWYARNKPLARALLQHTLFLEGEAGDAFGGQIARFVERQAGVIAQGQASGHFRADVDATLAAHGFFADYFLLLMGGLRDQFDAPTQLQMLRALTAARIAPIP